MDLCNPLNRELPEVLASLFHRCGRHRVISRFALRVRKNDSGYDGVVTHVDSVQERDSFVEGTLIGETVEQRFPKLIVNDEAHWAHRRRGGRVSRRSSKGLPQPSSRP